MTIEYVRVFRTASSERYFLRSQGVELGCLDLHYLANGTVQALLILYEGTSGLGYDINFLLRHIDDVLLPEVSMEDSKLLYTVFHGRALGAFEPPTPPVLDSSGDKDQ